MSYLRDRINRAARSGIIERFGDFPGLPFLGCDLLQVPSCHVKTHSVAVDVIERGLDRNIRPSLPDSRHQLHFMVVVAGDWGIWNAATVLHNHAISLGEEKGRCLLVVSHF